MAAADVTGVRADHGGFLDRFGPPPRDRDETRYETTEFYAYVAAVIGVLIASAMIGGDDDAGRGAGFGHYFRTTPGA